ncbi:MAG: DUF1385 domain-containing protein [Acidobacteriia bacterium]|nr:DUF1385 domain-containing protein [Terriglobia bacterium]
MSIRRFVRLAAHVQLLPVLESGEETLIGGQAVMEGVMMRAPHSYCVAVRKANGEVVTESRPLAKVSEKYPIFKYPVLRGLGTLGQAMSLGIKALKFSANAALEEEIAAGKAKPEGVSGWVMTLNMVFSLAFFIFLYKFVPLWITTKLGESYPDLQGRIAFNFTDGVIRIAIFLGFLYLISRWKDIHRVFEYHGAEHRVVFNYESGEDVTVARAQSFTTFHPRCGTSFLIVVMLISMAVYTVIPVDTFAAKMAARIALLPVIAGLSYEVIRFAARRRGSMLSLLTAPGLWLQRITTQPPEPQQTEIAIIALQGAMALEQSQGGELVVS